MSGIGRSTTLQAARAVAALCVVLYHVAVYLERIRGVPDLHAFIGGRLGSYGVITFFVISGYLMADLVTRYSATVFLVHRLVRVYPIYWLCVAGSALYYLAIWKLALPDAGHIPAIKDMLVREGVADTFRLLLVPFQFPDFPLGIEWTLLYETTFYVLVFAVSALGLARWLLPLALAWLLLIVVATVINPASQIGYTQPTLLTLPLYQINAGFIFGIVVHACMRRGVRWPAGYFGVAMLLASEMVSGRWQTIGISLALAAIVLGLLQSESVSAEQRRPWRSLVMLGDWSYALYLVHVPVIVGVMKLVRPDIGPWALCFIAIGMSLLAAAAVGALDVRLYSLLKRWIDSRAPVAKSRVAWVYCGLFLAIAGLGVARAGV